jgi:hypothetical protein
MRIWFGSELLQQHLLKAFVDAPIPAHVVNHFECQNHDSFFSCSDSDVGWWQHQCVSHAVALRFDHQQMSVMNESIDHRGGHALIGIAALRRS